MSRKEELDFISNFLLTVQKAEKLLLPKIETKNKSKKLESITSIIVISQTTLIITLNQ